MNRQIFDGKIETVDIQQICSNFDLAEEEIAEFLKEGISGTPVNDKSPADSIAGDISGLTICVGDAEPEQKE
jgi:hypothetical protein